MVRRCAYDGCARWYIATDNGGSYCCAACRAEAAQKRQRLLRQAERAVAPPRVSFAQVEEFVRSYEKKTGRRLHYGEAVARMDGRLSWNAQA